MRKFLFRSILFILVVAAGVATGGYYALVKGVPQIDEIKGYSPLQGTKVYADDDTLVSEFKVDKGIYVPISRIPEHMIRALVAVEDSRFWQHKGIDYLAIIRAVVKDAIAGRIKEGASTLTQQLAKVIFLSPEKTVVRKLKEVILAFRLEKNLTKEEILELYLNKVYFGQGAYGAEMAAKAYFGKSISNVTLSEAALLVGLVKAPNKYSPYNDLDKAKERQHVVLRRMQEEGYIKKDEMERAYEQPLHLSSTRTEMYTQNYFLDYVRKYLEDKYGVDTVYKGGLKVYTTLNRRMQTYAVTALQNGLRELDKRQGFRGPLDHKDVDLKRELGGDRLSGRVIMKEGDMMTAVVLTAADTFAVVKARGVTGKIFLQDTEWAKKVINAKGDLVREYKRFKLDDILSSGDVIRVQVKNVIGSEPTFTLEQEPLAQGALVAMEPSTGYIRAIVGGYDFGKSEFNRAILARRQAGSAFKPIIYASAMDNGFTPASMIVDEPISYETEQFGEWKPENYDRKFRGPTRLREALAYSRNVVTIKLLEKVGVQRVIKFANSLGIEGPLPYNLSLALGSLSVTPLELTSAYCVFSNNGTKMEPVAVKYVLDTNGNVLENNEPRGANVISPQTAFLATSMLEDVVKYGTAKRALQLQRTVAGKTGTTNDYKDAWFIGYSSELVAGVWTGFDTLRTLGKKETGARTALPVWIEFMRQALPLASAGGGDAGSRAFSVPSGIVTATIDPVTGLLAGGDSEKMMEYFKEGTAPRAYSSRSQRDAVRKKKAEYGDTSIEDHEVD